MLQPTVRSRPAVRGAVRRARAVLVALALAVCTVPFSALPASAADNGLWAVEPMTGDQPGARDFFGFSLNPGQSMRDIVSVSNYTDQEILFKIFATDAFNSPRDGGFGLLGDDEEPTGVGSWIRLGMSEITVPARQRVDLAYEITVPTDAEPGDHAGGIVVTPANFEPPDPSEETLLAIRRRVGARVYVRVAGPITPSMRIDDFTIDRQLPLVPYANGRGDATITYTITNTGNTRVQPRAEMHLEGLFGRSIHRVEPRDLPELLPGGAIEVTEQIDGLPPIDRVSATVDVVSILDDSVTTTRTSSFWIIPWFPIVVLAAIAVLIVFVLRWRRRRGRDDEDAGPDAPAPEPEPERAAVPA